jgi:hypothetical protein
MMAFISRDPYFLPDHVGFIYKDYSGYLESDIEGKMRTELLWYRHLLNKVDEGKVVTDPVWIKIPDEYFILWVRPVI